MPYAVARVASAVVLAAIAFACASPRGSRPPVRPRPGFDRVAATSAVYEAVLHHERGPGIERFVIDRDPSLFAASLDHLDPGWDLRDDTAASFRRGGPGAMPRDLDAGLPIHWFCSADWEALPVPPGPAHELDARWAAFHTRFPNSGGHMAFSHVGFSQDGRQALVHMWSGSGSLGGAGHFYLLENRGGVWVVRDQVMTAIA